ncbi:MAG: hypothetical protein IPO63_14905 [Bacteroidetes bacterium]|nr:hypothetical protein [Bacteroidota bacterium]
MVKLPMLIAVFAWVVFGSFLYYNSKVLNTFTTSKENEKLQADYEKSYKRFESIPQPRVIAVNYQIDLFPVERRFEVKSISG